MKRGLVIAVSVAVLPPLLLASAFLFLFGTERGAQWLLQQQLPALTGDRLSIDQVQGNLLGTLEVYGLTWRSAETDLLDVQQLRLVWQPRKLLAGRLGIEALTADDIRLNLPEPQDEKDEQAGPVLPELPDIRLPLGVAIESLQLRRIRVVGEEGEQTVERVRLRARSEGAVLRIEQLQVEAPQGRLSVQGQAGLAGDWPLQLAMDWNAEIAGQSYAGQGRLSGPLAHPQLTHQLQQPYSVSSRGRLDLRGNEPRVAIAGEWQDVSIALGDERTLAAPQGDYHLEGSLSRYRAELQGPLRITALPPADVSLQLSGHGFERVEIQRLQLATLEGKIEGQGELRLAPQLGGRLNLSAEGLDPAAQWPQWSGNIGGQLQLQGRMAETGPQAKLELIDLQGQLRGYPVRGNGRLNVSQRDLTDLSLALEVADARLQANGSLTDRWDIEWMLEAPQLARVLPEAEGQVHGQGRIQGDRTAPLIEAQLHGEVLRWQALRLENLHALLNLDPTRPQDATAELRLEGLTTAAQRIHSARMTLESETTRQRITLQVDSERSQLQAESAGRLSAWAWDGELQQLRLESPRLGQWQLEKPVALAIAPQQTALGDTCLVREEARLCSDFCWSGAEGLRASGKLHALPLFDYLATFMPADVSGRGQLGGHFNLHWAEDTRKAELQLALSDASLSLVDATEQVQGFELRDVALQASLQDQRGQAELSGTIVDHGGFNARVELLAEQPGNWSVAGLNGEVEADFADLAFLDTLIPALQQTDGNLGLSLDLAGTLSRPKVTGSFTAGGRTGLVPLGVQLEDITLQADLSDLDRAQISGHLKSGPGQLDFQGQADWRGELTALLRLQGENVELVNVPEAHALASPDLTLRLEGRNLDLTGEVRVPEARIEIKEVPQTAVRVSEDEIVIREDAAEQARADRGLQVTSRVRVILGDEVTISALGFEGRITGNLRYEASPGQAERGFGDIVIAEGLYTAYGQKLAIRDGRISFAGPLDNPGLDIRAARTVRDVVAGIHISGTLLSLETELYSEPPMDQGEILSYIVLGRPLDEAGGGDKSALVGAIYGLGLKQGDSLAQRIGLQMGFDEIGVSGGETLQESAFLMGKQLTPRLYLRYVVGLFEAGQRLEISYQLTDHLSLESEHGQESGIDLIYSIEKD